MEDLGEASYVLGMQILCDKANGVLILSQKMYIDRVLKRFNMQSCSLKKAPIVKGDKFSRGQCPQHDSEKDHMKTVSYASAIGSLMYAQVCTRPDIAFGVGVLHMYLSDLGLSHWRVAKKVMIYFQGTKDLMLTNQ